MTIPLFLMDELNVNGLLTTLQNWVSGQGVNMGGFGVVAFLAGLAVSKGIVKQILNMITLTVSVLVAIYVFHHRTQLMGTYGSTMSTDTLLAVAGGSGLLTFFLTRGLVNFAAGFGLVSVLGKFTGWKAGVLSLLPSGMLVWLGAMVLRLMGGIYGMEDAAAGQKPGMEKSMMGEWVQKLAQKLDHSSAGQFLEGLDPYDVRAKSNLARLLILWPDGRVWQQLSKRDPSAAKALAHPEIQALGRDAKVRQAIERQDFAGLMQLPQIERAAANAQLEPFLKKLSLEESMDSIVYKKH
jgi:hypothetical protein